VPTRDPFRGFVAVPLPGDAAAALEAAARGFLGSAEAPGGDWRATPAPRIHLTLKFLGDTAAAAIPALGEALREAARAAAGPVRATVGGWLLLPGPRDPRVLAAEVSDPTGTLPRMAAVVEGRAEALGFPRESRRFLAHATVARRRRGRGRGRGPGDGRGGRAVPPPASGRGPILLDRLVLMESVLGPEGPEYSVVLEEALRGA